MTNPHIGSSFDDFLVEEGLLAEVETVAIKRILARQVSEAMKAQRLTKKAHGRAHGHQPFGARSPARSGEHLGDPAHAPEGGFQPWGGG